LLDSFALPHFLLCPECAGDREGNAAESYALLHHPHHLTSSLLGSPLGPFERRPLPAVLAASTLHPVEKQMGQMGIQRPAQTQPGGLKAGGEEQMGQCAFAPRDSQPRRQLDLLCLMEPNSWSDEISLLSILGLFIAGLCIIYIMRTRTTRGCLAAFQANGQVGCQGVSDLVRGLTKRAVSNNKLDQGVEPQGGGGSLEVSWKRTCKG